MDMNNLKLYYENGTDEKYIHLICTCEEGVNYSFLQKTTFEVLHTY